MRPCQRSYPSLHNNIIIIFCSNKTPACVEKTKTTPLICDMAMLKIYLSFWHIYQLK